MHLNQINGEVKKISLPEFLTLFAPAVQDAIVKIYAREDVSGVVCYENLDLSSSQIGTRSALAYGPGCQVKTIEEAAKYRLGDVPSRFQYPVAYASKTI